MLSDKMLDALNAQLNAELYSSYLYLSMSGWCERRNLRGLAHWMRMQAGEEYDHAMKFFNYVNDRLGTVSLKAVDQPPSDWGSPLEMFQDTLAHERKVTGLINGLLQLARKGEDNATIAFLQWFATEQVEEEAASDAIVRQLEMIGESTGALFMLDHVLGERKSGGQS